MIVLWTALGCAQGHLRWEGGDDVLRTALVQETTDGGLPHLTVVLSNSTFTCDLPSDPDPVAQTQALLDLSTAACREGAEHVLIELWRADGQDWQGVYTGDPEAGPALLGAERTHLADASWYGIDEAALASTRDFVRTYGVTLSGTHRFDHIGEGGEVELLDGEGTRGRFDFPDASLSGRFQAERCEPGASLFALLANSPVAACPVVGT
ncbi:MAG: hypothetical protein H6736_06575 [Alphaproteobacteria bacterium]|nr:hypothetical protein [Alphaproteobacteria bacterium]